MTNSVAPACRTHENWTIVFDDTCPVVHKLSWILRHWDRERFFRYIGCDTTDGDQLHLVQRLAETPWSLMLIDGEGQSWHGPEAIPFILKHLPSGKIAAVTYTIPGTMWLTRQLYYMVSRNRQYFNSPAQTKLERRSA